MLAEATGIEEQGKATAVAERSQLVAHAAGQEAEAVAVEKMGLAKAAAAQAKFLAEAKGLADKLAAMQAMEGPAKDHEEFRIQLEHDRVIALEALHTQIAVAKEQAHVMGEAFGTADIKIMGGDGQFFDQFLEMVSVLG